MEFKTFPRKDIAYASTSTELGCAKCGQKILPYQQHFVDRELYYHDGCEPQEKPVVHKVDIEDKFNITKDGAD